MISLPVTEGHRLPRKGRGRGASGIWLPSHRKDNSRTWIVQGGEFPDMTQTRLTFWPHPAFPTNSNQTQEEQDFEGKKKVIKGHKDINYGVSKSDVVDEWEIMRINSGRAERELSQSEGERIFRAPECRVMERIQTLLVSHVEIITLYLRAALLSFWSGYSSLYWTTLCLEEC